MRITLTFIIAVLLTLMLFVACMVSGAVDLPVRDCLQALLSPSSADMITHAIVIETRLPMAVAALMCGISLSVAGLLLQTTFQNPLAGPSILGVSTGASMGVALLMMSPLAVSPLLATAGAPGQLSVIGAAIIGACVVMTILVALSSVVRSAAMLLIAGIMIGYLCSALISWLNFFAPAHEVKNYAVWGMGSFMGVNISQLPLFVLLTLPLCVGTIFLSKPLNALLCGDEYASTIGYTPGRVRTLVLIYSSVLTAIATAYCGPVAFIGLTVPHLSRMALGTTHHLILIPGTIVIGAATGLLCAWMCVLPSSVGVLPLGAVTPIIGIPVIMYVIIRRKRIYYFN